ncbi:MAG: sigma-70 family RNA polymerase sigma factor [Polyangiaceae bacterium]
MNPHYLAQILELALLSHAEEHELAARWRNSGDQAARNQLIQAHLRLVPPIARRYYRPGGSLSELIAEGNLGLLQAAAKFEPERGLRFATYATHWIRALVSECATRSGPSAVKAPRTLRKVRREHIRAMNLAGEAGEARRIVCERLQMRASTVDDLLDLLQHRRVPVDMLYSGGKVLDSALCARELDPEESLLRSAERSALKEAVRDALTLLTVREQRIVAQRLMADTEAVVTLQALGIEFGVSRERVRQVEVNVKRKLLSHFRALSARTAEVACDAA